MIDFFFPSYRRSKRIYLNFWKCRCCRRKGILTKGLRQFKKKKKAQFLVSLSPKILLDQAVSLPSQSIKLTASCSESCIYFKVATLAVSAPFPPSFFFSHIWTVAGEKGPGVWGDRRWKRRGSYFRPCFPKPSTSEPQDRPSCCEIMDQLLRSEDKQHSSSSPGGYPRSGAF